MILNEPLKESQTLLFLSYFRQHPALALSVSYALLTLCGISYSACFYHEFDIAILKLTNISDLMIAGLSEPIALLMFFGGILVVVCLDLSSKYIYNRWQGKPKSIQRTLILAMSYSPKKSEFFTIAMIGCFALYAHLFVSWFAEWHSERIKQGYGDQIMVSSDVLGTEAKPLTLLGSTTHFLITYNPDDMQVIAIPVENLDKLTAIPSDPDK